MKVIPTHTKRNEYAVPIKLSPDTADKLEARITEDLGRMFPNDMYYIIQVGNNTYDIDFMFCLKNFGTYELSVYISSPKLHVSDFKLTMQHLSVDFQSISKKIIDTLLELLL